VLAFAGLPSWAGHVANFFNQNWTGFLRMMLADHIVYQSAYSREAYRAYFPRKPGSVVVNGADLAPGVHGPSGRVAGGALRLVTIFDEWRPSKRLCDLISFVKWVHEVKGAAIELTLLGYTGRFPVDAPQGIKDWVEQLPCFRTLPRFKSFEGEAGQALLDADMYLTFSYRDACPNVVVEAMAHGLPVVGVSSGGIPDIVGDAGVLIDANDPGTFFSASRFDSDFPAIDFEQVWTAVQLVGREQAVYRERVVRRFEVDLGMDVVVARYRGLLSEVGQRHE
jgi:glycosyltransferase involved in cell wall biosynthesis